MAKVFIAAVAFTAGLPLFAAAQTITTVAGGGPVGPAPAVDVNLRGAWDVSLDAAGNRYITSPLYHRVFRVDADGILTVAAGNGAPGYTGDGGPAPEAGLGPQRTAVDGAGNIYIAAGDRVRKVAAVSGVISTIAGTGGFGFSGDGGPATSAELGGVNGVAVDAAGNVYTAEGYPAHRVRRIDAATGIITTVAGNGTNFFGGDGGPATNAGLFDPLGIAVDAAGNIYIADTEHSRVRRVAAATGVITTVAGNGLIGFSGDGGLATNARISVADVEVGPGGVLYIADTRNRRIRRVSGGIITTIAGNGLTGFSGDGGPATGASLNSPRGVAVAADGTLYIADGGNNRVRKVDPGTGVISTVAGTGQCCFGGDGGPAVSAFLGNLSGIAADASGNVFIPDTPSPIDFAERVRRVDASTGLITTFAGNGILGFSGDGGPATSASMAAVSDVAADPAGNLIIPDYSGRVWKVDAASGIIHVVAGTGNNVNDGDGGPAIDASLVSYPANVASDRFGNIFVLTWNGFATVRKIDAATGVITTLGGFNGSPIDFAVDSAGRFYFVEYVSNSIQRVDYVIGTVTTVAGNGVAGFGGDGGAALNASLNQPRSIAIDGADNLFIADWANARVRRVDAATGVITTVAGDGVFGFKGDGGPPEDASLAPTSVAIDAAGNIYVGDTQGGRVRKITGVAVPLDSTPPAIAAHVSGASGNGGWYRSDVSVSWTVTDSQSAVRQTLGCDGQSALVDTIGVTFTCEATSFGGTADESVTIKRDATPPMVHLTGGPSAGGSYYFGAVPPVAMCEASDEVSGLAGPCTLTGYSTSVGAHTVTATATDNAGNQATASITYTVLPLTLSGLHQPIDMNGVWNVVKNGSTVPLKFEVFAGATELTDTSLVVQPLTATQVACNGGATDEVELVASGGTSLRYDTSDGQFIYNWKTPKQAGYCYVVTVRLADGSSVSANVRTK